MNPNVATMALASGDVGYSALIGSVIGASLKGAKLKMILCSQDRTPLTSSSAQGVSTNRFCVQNKKTRSGYVPAGPRETHTSS